MRISPGTRIGRYEVVAHIGTGGMGEVYRARDANLEKDVAVKVIAEAFAADATALPRFDRERRVGAVLEHPHICRLLDAGRAAAVDYLVMELLDGEPLSARLSRGPLPIHEALGYAIEIADALRYAHAHDVLHRDLKPANVFLSSSGAKVLDFGLAKLRTELAQGGRAMGDTAPIEVTKHNEVLGSAPYMAPERLEGHEADTRTDIFAFGVLVYEMVTGRRAFARDSTAATLAALMAGDLPPMQLPASPGPDLEWIVRKAVARNPADRWQSMADVHALLKRLAGTGLSQPVATAGRSLVDAGAHGARPGECPWCAGVRLGRTWCGSVRGADRLVRRPSHGAHVYADRGISHERPAGAVPRRSCTGLRRDRQQWLSAVVAAALVVAGADTAAGHRGRHVSVLVSEWRLRRVLRASGAAHHRSRRWACSCARAS